MKWQQIPVGPLQENTYLLWNDKKQALIIDPGSEGKRLIEAVQKNSLQLEAILLTHAHYDHIGAVEDVRNAFDIPVYIHKNEQDWLIDPTKNGSARSPFGRITTREADHVIEKAGKLSIGSFSFDVFETPGHSPGSVSYYLPPANVVFSGDALFQGSIGRTDLPGGNHEQLIESIHNYLLTLPEETVVSPGHGPETTIANEMVGNPFLTGF